MLFKLPQGEYKPFRLLTPLDKEKENVMEEFQKDLDKLHKHLKGLYKEKENVDSKGLSGKLN